ncbi:MAG: dickkopf-related protein, partial [Myxococcota bacterium]
PVSAPALVVLGPADRVAVAGGHLSWLRPEGADRAAVLAGTADGNDDGDPDDSNVFLQRNRVGSPVNLGRAATAVRMSEEWIAALVSERGDNLDPFLEGNQDGDNGEAVLEVNPVATATGTSWVSSGVSATNLGISGSVVGFTTSEREEGAVDRTLDGDLADRFIQVFDAEQGASGTLFTVEDADGRAQPARDFVLGPESSRCVSDPTGASCSVDADCAAGEFCDGAESCRVLGGACESDSECASDEVCKSGVIVAFRTLEFDLCEPLDALPSVICRGEAAPPPGCVPAVCDLNGDGDCCDGVLQAYDTLTQQLVNSRQTIRPCVLEACDPRTPYVVGTETVSFLTFECDEGGPDFASCDGIFGGSDLNGNGVSGDLLVQEWTVRSLAVRTIGLVDDDPPPGLGVDPLGEPDEEDAGGAGDVFLSSGRCIETTSFGCLDSTDCVDGQFCDTDGFCARERGVCLTDADCSLGSSCVPDVIVAAAADSDADGVADPFDNCPNDANAAQRDLDGDGVGDACDGEVSIDIKPGGDANDVACNADQGPQIPVAILTTAAFDATTVDHTTVTFEGASERHVNRDSGEAKRHEKDVDSDGDLDLVFHFILGETNLTCASTEGVLTGETFDSRLIEGSDSLRMISAFRGVGCGLGPELALVLPALMWLHERRRRRTA